MGSKRLVKHIIPRAIRNAMRNAYEATLDSKAVVWQLLLATSETPAMHDKVMRLDRYIASVLRLLEQAVELTTGADDGEQRRLSFA